MQAAYEIEAQLVRTCSRVTLFSVMPWKKTDGEPRPNKFAVFLSDQTLKKAKTLALRRELSVSGLLAQLVEKSLKRAAA